MLRYPALRRAGGLFLVAGALVGCGTAAPVSSDSAGGPVRVVAAENFWGSIAAQLGGDRVRVTSIVTRPDTDPHTYEATPADARAVATARYVIVNGVGYDAWANRLVRAGSGSERSVLDVGESVGVKAGANPHLWYAPAVVHRVVDRITADYERLDPADGAYFARQRAAFLTGGLGTYDAAIADIKARFGGTPIGASESIVEPIATALGLDLVTPGTFLRAISEGGDPTAADKSTVDAQIADHRVRVYVVNSQNSTPDVQAEVARARASNVPVVSFTETLTPPGATFQDWQVAQLHAVAEALSQGAGR